MNKTLEYREKYLDYYKTAKPGWNRASLVYDYILEHKPESILDIGCGWAHLIKWAETQGITATGIDFASPVEGVVNQLATDPFPVKSVDMVTSFDFFEHLYECEVDKVLSQVRDVCLNMFLVSICSHQSITKFRNGETIHNTVKDQDWWIRRIESHGFKHIETLERQETFQVFHKI